MEKTSRMVVGTWGGVVAGTSLFWLAFIFFLAHCWSASGLDAEARFREFVRVMRDVVLLTIAIGGTVGLHVGLFLGMKAASAPPRFWRHTGWHLVVASALAWALTAALFVAFALWPK